MDLINLPSVSNMFDQIATSSKPMFNEFLPLGLFGLGFFVGAVVIVMIMKWISGGLGSLIHGKNPHDKYDQTHP